MASVASRSSLPVNRRPSQTLSDVGIVLPNIHLGSFSQMTFDFDAQYTPPQRPTTEYYNSLPATSPNSFSPSRPSSSNGKVLSTRNGAGDWERQSPKSSTSPTKSRPQRDQSPPTSSQPFASDQYAYKQDASPLPTSFPSGSALLTPESINKRASSVPSRQDGESTIRGTGSVSGEDISRNQPIEGQLKEVVNGHRRIESVEPPYPPSASPRRVSPNRDPSARVPSGSWAYPTPPGPEAQVAPNFTPSPTGPSVRPQFVQKVVAPEEVCIECMMRDRDMADVDVTGAGVWERESDVWYDELVRKEQEEARAGIPVSTSSNKVRSQGGLLTEGNIKVWLTMVRIVYSIP